jgi:hypothetical protein
MKGNKNKPTNDSTIKFKRPAPKNPAKSSVVPELDI